MSEKWRPVVGSSRINSCVFETEDVRFEDGRFEILPAARVLDAVDLRLFFARARYSVTAEASLR